VNSEGKCQRQTVKANDMMANNTGESQRQIMEMSGKGECQR